MQELEFAHYCTDMSNEIDKIIKRDILRMTILTSIVVLVLVGIVVFSPLALQIHDDRTSRGAYSSWEIDSMVTKKDYQGALALVDSMIEDEEKELPRFAFFDRYLSEDEQYDVMLSRATVYKLQWKRIEILKAKNDVEKLKDALEDYQWVIGYNQEKAKALLNQIENE